MTGPRQQRKGSSARQALPGRTPPLLFLLLLATACESDRPEDSAPPDRPDTSAPSAAWFEDRTAESGIDFVHHHGGSGRKYLVEINAGCVAMLDYDGDGDLDLFFGQGAPLPGFDNPDADLRDRLYRNDGSFHFTDVTDETSATEDGYTYHAAAADYDGDGDPDLFLCNFGRNRLLRNDAGHFVEVLQKVSAGPDRWSTAAQFADFDGDGDLDLYVANYCVYPLDHKGCGRLHLGEEWRAYCAPDEFPGAQDQLYRNDGGCFVEVTEEAGMVPAEGSALGLVASDIDDDGDLDLFVANDGRPNFLWRNNGGMRFQDIAWESGTAVSNLGISEACMGTDFADIDHDGDPDLLVANLAVETNTLYRNRGEGYFEDDSVRSGLGPPSKQFVGFGCEFFDVDNDMDVDVMVANGNVIDNIHLLDPSQTFYQRPHLYLNDGTGRFEERGAEYGDYFRREHVGRGLAVGDLDNDGDLDVVVAHNNAAPVILENRRGQEKSWIGFQLIGKDRNTAAIGARVRVTVGGVTQTEEVRGTSSYGAFQDLRLHFGMGDHEVAERVEIRWPRGKVHVETQLKARKYWVIREP